MDELLFCQLSRHVNSWSVVALLLFCMPEPFVSIEPWEPAGSCGHCRPIQWQRYSYCSNFWVHRIRLKVKMLMCASHQCIFYYIHFGQDSPHHYIFPLSPCILTPLLFTREGQRLYDGPWPWPRSWTGRWTRQYGHGLESSVQRRHGWYPTT